MKASGGRWVSRAPAQGSQNVNVSSDFPRAQPFQHVVSLGLRCVVAKSFQDAGLRQYALPFDWIFCSLEMVTRCIRDHCAELLRREAYWEVTTMQDVVRSENAIAELTPRGIHCRGAERGTPAHRTRVLIGHSTFSPMQRGVGKDVIFNHTNPLEEQAYAQLMRQAERLDAVLGLRTEQKLFVVTNINWQLWDIDAVLELFEELKKRTASFLLLAVNCVRNQGEDARGLPPQELLHRHDLTKGAELLVYEMRCVANCTGAHFSDRGDTKQFLDLLHAFRSFQLHEGDPLEYAPKVAAHRLEPCIASLQVGMESGVESGLKEESTKNIAQRRRWGKREVAQVEDAAATPMANSFGLEPVPLDSKLQLRLGVMMPRFGLGTWQSAQGGICRAACVVALRQGYRLIDTAQAYQNESDVGEAVRQVNLPREEIFVVTKLHAKWHGSLPEVRAGVEESLRQLHLDFVDLFLIHSPMGGFIRETYSALLSLRDQGLCRAVGVSNFGIRQLQGLEEAGLELPEVNQIELHCWLQQQEVVKYCHEHGIALMAYSPLARAQLFGKTRLRELADQLGRSEPDIAIRWAIQQGFVVIPKSATPARISANASALQGRGLDNAAMATVADLDHHRYSACPAASSAMNVPWCEVELGVPSWSKGKGKSQANSSAYASHRKNNEMALPSSGKHSAIVAGLSSSSLQYVKR